MQAYNGSFYVPMHFLFYAQKKTGNKVARLKNLCLCVTDYRTFIEDYLKVLDFIEWLKEFYPEKAVFLTEET